MPEKFIVRLRTSLLAGAIAITLNMLALWFADLINLPTAHGGLLKLVTELSGIPVPPGELFKAFFHFAVGLGMALAYGFLLEPLWRRSALSLGVIYGVAVWLGNAFVVLPMTQQGIAGSAHLGLPGMAWFAAAHMLFFIALALIYAVLQSDRSPA